MGRSAIPCSWVEVAVKDDLPIASVKGFLGIGLGRFIVWRYPKESMMPCNPMGFLRRMLCHQCHGSNAQHDHNQFGNIESVMLIVLKKNDGGDMKHDSY